MVWRDGLMLAFDTETTGPDPETARLVSVAVLFIEGTAVEPYTWLINPGVPIPDEAASIHGITTATAQAQGRPMAEAVPEILATLRAGISRGAPVVAFNASFDLTLLDREARRLSIAPLEPCLVVDPYVIDKGVDRFRHGSRRLFDVAAHYGVPLGAEELHGASADALATARIAWRLGGLPSIAGMTLADLHSAQVAWRREQALSLAEYDARRGISRPIQAEWPIIPFGSRA